jgi:hypothetical protein
MRTIKPLLVATIGAVVVCGIATVSFLVDYFAHPESSNRYVPPVAGPPAASATGSPPSAAPPPVPGAAPPEAPSAAPPQPVLVTAAQPSGHHRRGRPPRGD